MKTIAFVGPSGTGKSYQSIVVSQRYNADAIIDDGLLISHGKVIAGTSAKKESTRIASVKHALLMNDKDADEIKNAIKNSNIECLMILGTSQRMAQKIASRLDVLPITQTIHIEDVATPDEIKMAQSMRLTQGKHVIPVPAPEIKKDFSGYFLHPFRLFQKNLGTEDDSVESDKSIVRPSFSYMGDFIISDNVLIAITEYEAKKTDGIHKINSTNIRKSPHGIHFDISATLNYGYNLTDVLRKFQCTLKQNIEEYTSVNVRRVNIYIKSLYIES